MGFLANARNDIILNDIEKTAFHCQSGHQQGIPFTYFDILI